VFARLRERLCTERERERRSNSLSFSWAKDVCCSVEEGKKRGSRR